jgi:hypothetical protein
VVSPFDLSVAELTYIALPSSPLQRGICFSER